MWNIESEYTLVDNSTINNNYGCGILFSGRNCTINLDQSSACSNNDEDGIKISPVNPGGFWTNNRIRINVSDSSEVNLNTENGILVSESDSIMINISDHSSVNKNLMDGIQVFASDTVAVTISDYSTVTANDSCGICYWAVADTFKGGEYTYEINLGTVNILKSEVSSNDLDGIWMRGKTHKIVIDSSMVEYNLKNGIDFVCIDKSDMTVKDYSEICFNTLNAIKIGRPQLLITNKSELILNGRNDAKNGIEAFWSILDSVAANEDAFITIEDSCEININGANGILIDNFAVYPDVEISDSEISWNAHNGILIDSNTWHQVDGTVEVVNSKVIENEHNGIKILMSDITGDAAFDTLKVILSSSEISKNDSSGFVISEFIEVNGANDPLGTDTTTVIVQIDSCDISNNANHGIFCYQKDHLTLDIRNLTKIDSNGIDGVHIDNNDGWVHLDAEDNTEWVRLGIYQSKFNNNEEAGIHVIGFVAGVSDSTTNHEGYIAKSWFDWDGDGEYGILLEDGLSGFSHLAIENNYFTNIPADLMCIVLDSDTLFGDEELADEGSCSRINNNTFDGSDNGGDWGIVLISDWDGDDNFTIIHMDSLFSNAFDGLSSAIVDSTFCDEPWFPYNAFDVVEVTTVRNCELPDSVEGGLFLTGDRLLWNSRCINAGSVEEDYEDLSEKNHTRNDIGCTGGLRAGVLFNEWRNVVGLSAVDTLAGDLEADEYIIYNDITIPPDSSLTIEEGTVFYLDQDVDFYVQGAIDIDGAETEDTLQVLFYGLDDAEWEGIKFNNDGFNAFVGGVIIEDSYRGIYCWTNDMMVTVRNSIINETRGYGVYIYSGSCYLRFIRLKSTFVSNSNGI